jgi:hypothetical protein
MVGALCISIDLELAWGIWDKPSAEAHGRCEELEHFIVDRLVDRFECYGISATWAIVGRLLEQDAARQGGIWFAPNLVERVRDASVTQDIGSHGYAHLYFGETDRESLRADLAAARRVHDAHGLPFESFVFPRNQIKHLDLLREVGIRVFRSVDLGWHRFVRSWGGAILGRAANFLDKAVPIPPATVVPVTHQRLVELPSSMLLLARKGVRRAIPPRALVTKASLGLEAARRTGEVFHLWFHPSNFYYDTARQIDTLDQILRRACQLRDRGELEIRPMNSFAV